MGSPGDLELGETPVRTEILRQKCTEMKKEIITSEPLYNRVRQNTVLDKTLIIVGPQVVIFLYVYIFYFRYNTDWIANMEIGLYPNNKCYCGVIGDICLMHLNLINLLAYAGRFAFYYVRINTKSST